MKKKNLFSAVLLAIPVLLHAQIQFINSNALLKDKAINSAIPVAVSDMNGDGLDDIVSMDDGHILFVQYQVPDKTRSFVRYEVSRSVDLMEQNDICIADFNNDGYNDILTVGSYDRIKLFYAIPHTYQYQLVYYTVTPFFSQGASAGDFNHDGWMDVVLLNDNGANYTMMNDGAGNLSQQTLFDWITVPASDNSGNYGSLYTDFDMDGDLDFYIAKCRQGVNNPADPRRINVLHVNDGTGVYTENAAQYGLAIGHQSWTADFGDVDNDGDLDCFITEHDVISELYENINNDTFVNITPSTGLNIGGVPLQGMLRDFDNDGYLDILVSGDRLDYYHNNGDKTFTKEAPFGNTIFGAFALGDLNHDGFTDVYASHVIPFNNPDPLRPDILYLNSGNSNHYLALSLHQTGTNPSAIGAMALLYGPWGIQVREVRSGEQYGVSNSHSMIFGLGQETAYDSLVIRWPDQTRQTLTNLAVDQYHYIPKSGCTYTSAQLFDAFKVLCNNDSIILKADALLNVIQWSTGETADSIVVRTAGLYYLEASGTDQCAFVSAPIEISTDPDTIKPEISYDGPPSLCRADVVELALPNAVSYQWSSGETTQYIQPHETGAYYALVQGYCKAQYSDTIHLDFLIPSPPSVEPDTFQAGETAVLTASGDSIVWYADANGTIVLGTGPSLSLNDLTETTTVYAQNINPLAGFDYQVGPVTQQGNNKYNAPTINGGLNFDVLQPITLRQVTVYTDTIGPRTIEVFNNASGFLFQKHVDLEAGKTVLDLDVDLEVGSYVISTNTPDNVANFGVNSPFLWRSSSGLLYPYTVPDVMSITTSTYGDGFYYYFYDWNITTQDRYCTSDLVPAEAFFDMGVGIEPVSDPHTVLISPNPTQGTVQLELKNTQPVTVEVMTMDGRKLFEERVEPLSHPTLDLSGLNAGIYLVRFSQDGKWYAAKMVKL